MARFTDNKTSCRQQLPYRLKWIRKPRNNQELGQFNNLLLRKLISCFGLSLFPLTISFMETCSWPAEQT